VTFEGGEGSGKSTQIVLLYEHLLGKGLDAVILRDPGSTAVGEKIRRILKDKESVICTKAEALFYFGVRAQMVDEVILPSLAAGRIVLCDRFADSTFAYQGFGNRLCLDTLKVINDFVAFGVWPKLTFFLELSYAEGLKRKTAQAPLDRIEVRGLDYHKRVEEGYKYLAKEDERRVVTIDATLPVDEIQSIIRRKFHEAYNGNNE
jgi:dTMP kinase